MITSGFSVGFLNGGEGAKDERVQLCTFMMYCDYMLVRTLLGHFEFDSIRPFDAMLHVLVIYLLMTFTVLLNLLLANMADTFSRIFDRSVTEWKFDRVVLCEKLRGIATMLAKVPRK